MHNHIYKFMEMEEQRATGRRLELANQRALIVTWNSFHTSSPPKNSQLGLKVATDDFFFFDQSPGCSKKKRDSHTQVRWREESSLLRHCIPTTGIIRCQNTLISQWAATTNGEKFSNIPGNRDWSYDQLLSNGVSHTRIKTLPDPAEPAEFRSSYGQLKVSHKHPHPDDHSFVTVTLQGQSTQNWYFSCYRYS